MGKRKSQRTRPDCWLPLQFNETMDYSYEITPLSQLHGTNTSNFKPHIPQPNWGMPAYVNKVLAWGSPPVAVRFQDNKSRCREDILDGVCTV